METRVLIPELLKAHLTSVFKDTSTATEGKRPDSPPLLAVSQSHSQVQVKRERSESLEAEGVRENVKQFKSNPNDDVQVSVTPRSVRRLRKSPPQSRARIQRAAEGMRHSSGSRSRSSPERDTYSHVHGHNGESESEPEVGGDDSASDNEMIFPDPVKRTVKLHQHHKNEGDDTNGVVQKVQICARGRISAGTRLDPKDGQLKVLTLDEHTTAPASEEENEVRSIFGCFDRFIEDPSKLGERIRLCSWMKFVSSSPNQSSGSGMNLVAKFVDRTPVLEFSQEVDPGEEIVVFFDLESIHRSIGGMGSIRFGINFKEEASESNHTSLEENNLKEGPLDLSGGKSPDSHKSFASHSRSSGSSRQSPPTLNDHSTPKRPRNRSSSPASSISSCPSSNEDSQSQGRKMKHRPTAANGSSIFSIRNVLQMQSSPSTAFFQPQLFNSNHPKASNSHPEQLILTPPLSSSTTNATATALSSPADSNRSLLSSPSGCGSNPKLSPYEPPTPRHKLTHSNLHTMLSQYGFNAGLGSGGGGGASSAANVAGLGAPSLLRPILRTRGRERSLLPCEVCNKAFDRPSLLKRHMRTHTGEKPHVCDTCGKGFSTSSSLNTHRRIHSGEKPHQCPICGKRFTASSNLYYHRMTHNKEKPHKCLLCGKSFPTPGDLKSHQYVHSGSWPFSCRICNRGFSKQTNLRNHLLLHSGDKPHACRICNKKFALACNLRAHLRTHEEDSLSTCVSCKRSFVNSSNMVVDGQCRICAASRSSKMNAKLSNSLLPTHFAPIPSIDGTKSEDRGRRVSPSKFHSTGTLTSNITIPQPPSTATAPSSELERNRSSSSPESHSRQELHRKLPVLNNFGHGHHLAAFHHGLQNPYHPLQNLQQSPSSASTSLAAIASGHGHQFPHPFLDHLHQLQLGPNFAASGRPNPFLEQLFEWNLRVAKETVGSLGLMQQKLLESQMLAAQLMSNPTGLSDLLRMQAGVSQGGRGIPTSNHGHDFSNVTGRLGLLDDKK